MKIRREWGRLKVVRRDSKILPPPFLEKHKEEKVFKVFYSNNNSSIYI